MTNGIPDPPNVIPTGLSDTVRYLQEWFTLVQSMNKDTNQRIDRMLENSAHRDESISGLREDVDDIKKRLDTLANVTSTQTGILSDIIEKVDSKMQFVGRNTDRIENLFSDTSARYQQSLNEMNRDLDEKFSGIGKRMDDIRKELCADIDSLHNESAKQVSDTRVEILARVNGLRTEVSDRRKEDTSITTTRMLTRAQIVVALIGLFSIGSIGGAIIVKVLFP